MKITLSSSTFSLCYLSSTVEIVQDFNILLMLSSLEFYCSFDGFFSIFVGEGMVTMLDIQVKTYNYIVLSKYFGGKLQQLFFC